MSPLPPARVPHPHVEVRADFQAGSPVVRGTTMPVRILWGLHRRGVTIELIVRSYPELGWSRVLDALAFAYDNPDVMAADGERDRRLRQERIDLRRR